MWSLVSQLWRCRHSYERKGQRLHRAHAAPQNESLAYCFPILPIRMHSVDSLTLHWGTSLFRVPTTCRVISIVQVAVIWTQFNHTEYGSKQARPKRRNKRTILKDAIILYFFYHRSYKIFASYNVVKQSIFPSSFKRSDLVTFTNFWTQAQPFRFSV